MDDSRNFGGMGEESDVNPSGSFHSIEQPLEPKPPVLGIVIRMKDGSGNSLTPNQFNDTAIARFCWETTGVMPNEIQVATAQDAVLRYEGEVNLVQIAMALQRVKEWQKNAIQVTTNIAGNSALHEICLSLIHI